MYVYNLHDLLMKGTLTERRAFIRSFVKEVRMTGNKATLTYTMPVLPQKITTEKERIL